MNPKIQSLIAKILLQSPVVPSRINFFFSRVFSSQTKVKSPVQVNMSLRCSRFIIPKLTYLYCMTAAPNKDKNHQLR